MAVKTGQLKSLATQMHASISYAPDNTSAEWRRARGLLDYMDGGTVGSRSSQRRVDEARAAADAVVLEVAHEAARLATMAYHQLGYSDLGVIVGPKTGTAYPLVVRGKDADKHARIIEGGSSGTDMESFIRHARKRREVKVVRKDPKTGKVRPRGKISEREEGFYLVVPRVLGTVKRTASGKFEFQGKAGRTLSRTNQDALKQFEATPEEEDFRTNHEDPTEVSEYRTGDRSVGFVPVKVDGKTFMQAIAEPEMDVGNELWPVVKYATKATKAGRSSGERDAKGNLKYDRPTQENPQTLQGGKQRANKRGFEAMKALGVQNLRVNSPDAGLRGGSAEAQSMAQKQKGQVVSFMTLSTRSAGGKRVGATPGHHVLKQAGEYMRDRLREEITAFRSGMNGRGGNFYERAYIELLESAAR